MKIVCVCCLTFSFTWCGDDCARTSPPPLTFKIQYTKVLLISTDFKLHHSLLSCRQFCWILTSEKKVEWCPVALSYTLCASDCAGTSHFRLHSKSSMQKSYESGQVQVSSFTSFPQTSQLNSGIRTPRFNSCSPPCSNSLEWLEEQWWIAFGQSHRIINC